MACGHIGLDPVVTPAFMAPTDTVAQVEHGNNQSGVRSCRFTLFRFVLRR
jgi:hypothetical protein